MRECQGKVDYARQCSSVSLNPTKNPLQGVTLEAILNFLVEERGWQEMAEQIPIRCFQLDPSIKSSLAFLRKTEWARKKVENWYVWELTRMHKAIKAADREC